MAHFKWNMANAYFSTKSMKNGTLIIIDQKNFIGILRLHKKSMKNGNHEKEDHPMIHAKTKFHNRARSPSFRQLISSDLQLPRLASSHSLASDNVLFCWQSVWQLAACFQGRLLSNCAGWRGRGLLQDSSHDYLCLLSSPAKILRPLLLFLYLELMVMLTKTLDWDTIIDFKEG